MASLEDHYDALRDRAPTDGTLHALYTRLVPGLDGHPKASRRIPNSRFTLDDDPERVRAVVAGDGPRAASDGFVLEAMRLASSADAARVAAWRRARDEDPEIWQAARATVADELAGYAREWQRTAGGE
jgi:tryptophanyl-tRNA synthetase